MQAAILACQAGLDVYCEKPLTLTIDEGKKLVAAVRRYGRVFQVGSQQRSMEMDRFACGFVRDGKLGRVSHVELPVWASSLRYQGLPEEPLPEGMEWELFCGPTPLRPYNWRLWQKDERNWEGKRWRGWDMWYDYSGHLVTNWGAHAVDIDKWSLGLDASLTHTRAEPRNGVMALKSLLPQENINMEKEELVTILGDFKSEMVKAAAESANAAVKKYADELAPEVKAGYAGHVQIVKDEAEQPFKSAGEFLMAVKNAAITPSQPDRRLLSLKATGLNEATPSQGGFLVQQDLQAGILQRMYGVGGMLSRFGRAILYARSRCGYGQLPSGR